MPLIPEVASHGGNGVALPLGNNASAASASPACKDASTSTKTLGVATNSQGLAEALPAAVDSSLVARAEAIGASTLTLQPTSPACAQTVAPLVSQGVGSATLPLRCRKDDAETPLLGTPMLSNGRPQESWRDDAVIFPAVDHKSWGRRAAMAPAVSVPIATGHLDAAVSPAMLLPVVPKVVAEQVTDPDQTGFVADASKVQNQSVCVHQMMSPMLEEDSKPATVASMPCQFAPADHKVFDIFLPAKERKDAKTLLLGSPASSRSTSASSESSAELYFAECQDAHQRQRQLVQPQQTPELSFSLPEKHVQVELVRQTGFQKEVDWGHAEVVQASSTYSHIQDPCTDTGGELPMPRDMIGTWLWEEAVDCWDVQITHLNNVSVKIVAALALKDVLQQGKYDSIEDACQRLAFNGCGANRRRCKWPLQSDASFAGM